MGGAFAPPGASAAAAERRLRVRNAGAGPVMPDAGAAGQGASRLLAVAAQDSFADAGCCMLKERNDLGTLLQVWIVNVGNGISRQVPQEGLNIVQGGVFPRLVVIVVIAFHPRCERVVCIS